MPMINQGPQHILLPVRTGFMVVTLALALMFNLIPWGDAIGVPDLLGLVLVFWCIHQPRRMGIGAAWALGLVMDAGTGSLMGQHAFAYAVLAFLAIALHRRMLWFSLKHQAVHVLMLMLLVQALMLGVRMFAGAPFPGIGYFLGSFVAAAMWPLVAIVLLSPQRRPETVDENRPI
ncbi:MAG: rod shape-determining protein MreD [Betaproteobacteria bacterium]|nr:rod shape-determining protein MreD [Pseudomonadota bacterium]